MWTIVERETTKLNHNAEISNKFWWSKWKILYVITRSCASSENNAIFSFSIATKWLLTPQENHIYYFDEDELSSLFVILNLYLIFEVSQSKLSNLHIFLNLFHVWESSSSLLFSSNRHDKAPMIVKYWIRPTTIYSFKVIGLM